MFGIVNAMVRTATRIPTDSETRFERDRDIRHVERLRRAETRDALQKAKYRKPSL